MNYLKTLMVAATLAMTTTSFAQESSVYSTTDPDRRQLSGEWQFREAESNLWQPATVPGTVHTDLLNSKRIPEPYYRLNEHYMQWIDKRDWEYSTLFDVTTEEFNSEKLSMIFDGLDTFADVYINGKLALEADNMFRVWNVDLKEFAVEGQNTLNIYFHSAVKIGLDKYYEYGIDLPAGNDQSVNGELLENERVSVYVRKAPYHFGWDWGPRLVTCGVWKPIYIVAQNDAKVTDVYYNQKNVTAKKAEIAVETTINSLTEGEEVTVEVFDKENNVSLATTNATLVKGDNSVVVPLNIKNPELWWSNGLGEAHLYDLAVRVVKGGEVVSSFENKVGVRSLKVRVNKDKAGYSLYFELNGEPVFMKGANHIPNDLLVDRMTREVYEKEIADAVDANMNMIRVWGGGIYENDYFYELCDKYGVLIWQDFMFACSMYPNDEAFFENVRQEAIDNVKRLRNHPSIALWCGNNEIDGAWSEYIENSGWGWKKEFTAEQREEIWGAYVTIFKEILPEVVSEYDEQAAYRHSSPCTFEPENHSSYTSTLGDGDIHYWGVWHGKEPFENFHNVLGRFMSEYGFQSFPEMRTIEQYALPEDYDIESEVMRSHQRSAIGNATITEYMRMYYQMPENFEDYIYLQQVLQAVGIGTAIEAHRHNMPHTMGTLYWQINDCWPVASWSSVDYYRRWKALHYYVRAAFNQVITTAKVVDGNLRAAVVNDNLTSLKGVEFTLTVMNPEGEVSKTVKLKKSVKANSVTEFMDTPCSELFSDANEFAVISAEQDGELLARNTFYPTKIKDMTLPIDNPVFHVKQLSDSSVLLSITAEKLVKNLWIDYSGTEGFFSDNYFDILPGETVEITFTAKESVDFAKLADELQFKHIGGLYQ